MSEPLVSIVIPTYKGAAFIAETIQSVLDQSYKPFEILIFDDGSPDNTVDICKSFDDPRIKFSRNRKNLGPRGNWNKCLAAATGKYYKLLPHDDLLMPGSLRAQVGILESNPDVALVFGTRNIISESGKPLMSRSPLGPKDQRFDGLKLVRKCIYNGSNFIGEPGNGLMRTSLTKTIGEYDDVHPYTIDLDYWFRALAHGEAYYIAAPHSAFRIHNASWTSEIGQDQHKDFVGTINKFSSDSLYKVSRITATLGKVNSALNMRARRLIFKKLASR